MGIHLGPLQFFLERHGALASRLLFGGQELNVGCEKAMIEEVVKRIGSSFDVSSLLGDRYVDSVFSCMVSARNIFRRIRLRLEVQLLFVFLTYLSLPS